MNSHILRHIHILTVSLRILFARTMASLRSFPTVTACCFLRSPAFAPVVAAKFLNCSLRLARALCPVESIFQKIMSAESEFQMIQLVVEFTSVLGICRLAGAIKSLLMFCFHHRWTMDAVPSLQLSLLHQALHSLPFSV